MSFTIQYMNDILSLMYEHFFGLKERPFNVTSDPAFLFFSRRHKEALAHLIYGINERKGFLEITGEIGTGKTTLCKALLNSLNNETKTTLILNPDLSKIQLLKAILQDLGINSEKNTTIELTNQLNDFLIRQLYIGNNVVLIIDEAQNLKPAMLEQVRLLSNLETTKEKLLQIVLVGQPELRDKLQSPRLRQLRQRISVRYHILPLEQNEIGTYINHRLCIAGGNDGAISFAEDAIREIFNYSSGIPRVINIVCDKTLLAAFVQESRTITKSLVTKCIRELEGNDGGSL
ncbi:MAG: AAA family ATPase [Candidatus Omnitrophota bacterium]